MQNHHFEYQNQQDLFDVWNRDQKHKLFWKLFLKHKCPCLWIINSWCKKILWNPFFPSETNYFLQFASGYPVWTELTSVFAIIDTSTFSACELFTLYYPKSQSSPTLTKRPNPLIIIRTTKMGRRVSSLPYLEKEGYFQGG